MVVIVVFISGRMLVGSGAECSIGEIGAFVVSGHIWDAHIRVLCSKLLHKNKTRSLDWIWFSKVIEERRVDKTGIGADDVYCFAKLLS